MRTEDRRIFAACAAELGVWILVRRTNPASLPYIGQSGFTPKRIDCKAKTADNGPQAGLVVCPELVSDAFNPEKADSAAECWEDFQSVLRGEGSPYGVDTNPKSERYGCLTVDGMYIHGDYDLYDIIAPEHARRNLRAVEQLMGQAHMRGPRFYQVRDYINGAIGSPMIQHGGEYQYKDHSDQILDVFGPNGERGFVNGELAAHLWYRERFDNRMPPFARKDK